MEMLKMLNAKPTYRPFLNRRRIIFILHAEPDELEAIADAFSRQGFITSTAQSVSALMRLVELRRPDVVIADLDELSSNLQLIPTIHQLAFGSRVFLLANAHPEIASVVRAVRSGAVSIFVRPFQLAEMIRDVSDELREDLRLDANGDAATVSGAATLTDRELETLNLVVAGQTNKEIALALGISPRTVEVHRRAAMRKLGARNTADLVRLTLHRH
jgi:two-component system response regulator FixJ